MTPARIVGLGGLHRVSRRNQCSRGKYIDFDVVEHGVASLLPSVETSAQGADAGDAEAVQLECDLGRGLLRRAGAVEDDVAVARNAFGVAGEFGGANADGAGQDARVGQIVQRVTEVDDIWLCSTVARGLIDHGFEVFRVEAEFADAGEEAAILDHAPEEESDDHEDKYAGGEVTEQGEEGLAALSDIAEEAAGEQEG